MDRSGVRRVVKGAAAGLIHYSGLRKAMSSVRRSQAGGRRVMIAGYHRVVEDFTAEVQRSIPGTLISKATLRRHLEDAHALGYDFASLADAVDVIAGRRAAKKDLFVVTFDDGYREVYEHAYPILKAMGVPSIIYLPTDFIGTKKRFNHDRLFHLIQTATTRRFKPLYEAMTPAAAVLLGPIFAGLKTTAAALDDFLGLYPTQTLTEIIDGLEAQLGGGAELTPALGEVSSWDEIRTMARNGVNFGAHTLGHCVLTLEPEAEVDRQISESKRIIEHELSQPCVDFAYCNGWYSEEVVRALVRHGFRSGVTTEDLLNRRGGDPFTLKRKILWENFSLGMTGRYSSPLTGCHIDDVFGLLNLHHPVLGKRPQSVRASPGGL